MEEQQSDVEEEEMDGKRGRKEEKPRMIAYP